MNLNLLSAVVDGSFFNQDELIQNTYVSANDFENILSSCDSLTTMQPLSMHTDESSDISSSVSSTDLANLEPSDLIGDDSWLTDLDEILTQHDFDDFMQFSPSSSPAANVKVDRRKGRKWKHKTETLRRGRRGPDLQVQMTKTDDGVTLYGCPECGLSFAEKSCLERHLTSHKIDRRFICEVCGVAMKRKEHIERHKLGHKDERPFSCNVCHKSFKRKEHHDIHYVIHSGEKTIICQECGKGFYRRDHLTTHMKSHVRRKIRKQRREEKLKEKRERIKEKSKVRATKPNGCDFIIHILTGSEIKSVPYSSFKPNVATCDTTKSNTSTLPPFTELKRCMKNTEEHLVPLSDY